MDHKLTSSLRLMVSVKKTEIKAKKHAEHIADIKRMANLAISKLADRIAQGIYLPKGICIPISELTSNPTDSLLIGLVNYMDEDDNICVNESVCGNFLELALMDNGEGY